MTRPPHDFYDDGLKNNNKSLNIKKIPDLKTAVALQYQGLQGTLPSVTAAGRGKIAEKILQLAFENGIKVREDGPLAQMLATLEIDSPIPPEALGAVVEILSYVYKANGQPNPFDAIFPPPLDHDPKDGRNQV